MYSDEIKISFNKADEVILFVSSSCEDALLYHVNGFSHEP